MSLRSTVTRTSYITICFILLMSSGYWHTASAGGDAPSLKEKSNQQMRDQNQTQYTRGTDPSSQIQPPSQPVMVTQANPQDTTSESPFSYSAMTQPGKLELGLIGGEPSGLSAKLWLSPTRAVDLALGWDVLGDDTNLQLHADYLFHQFGLFRPRGGELPVYAGLGARLRFGDEGRFGFRVPFGIQYLMDNNTVSLFAEVAPVIDFIPEAKGDVNFGVGIRFFFFQPDTQSRPSR